MNGFLNIVWGFLPGYFFSCERVFCRGGVVICIDVMRLVAGWD